MEYIIDQEPNLEIEPLTEEQIKKLSTIILTEEQLEKLLDSIVYKTRMAFQRYHNIDIRKHHLTGHCMEATDRICYGYGRIFDILHYRVETTFHPSINHSFAVGRFDTVEGVKRYIIDLTFRQFCLTDRCKEHKNQHTFIAPGSFFHNQELLRKLLEKGYIEVTRGSLTCYADSFVLAGKSLEDHRENRFGIIHHAPYNYEEYSEALETGKILVK